MRTATAACRALALVVLVGAPLVSLAIDQAALEDPDHNSVGWRVAAYSSAAPPALGDAATILDGDMTVLREGSNGWTCLPANPRGPANIATGWATPHEAMPICFDSEGMKWINGYMTSTAPNMTRDTFMWMLHGDMGEDNSRPGILSKTEASPGEWIESGPHLMMMPKDVASLEAYPTDFTTGAPYTMFAGSPYAHLMIPYIGYYQYYEEAADIVPGVGGEEAADDSAGFAPAAVSSSLLFVVCSLVIFLW